MRIFLILVALAAAIVFCGLQPLSANARHVHRNKGPVKPQGTATAVSNTVVATIYYNPTAKNYSIVFGEIDFKHGTAWASFTDNSQTTGWGELTISTSPNADDFTQMTAAGILEGALTHVDIWNFFQNQYADWGFSSSSSSSSSSYSSGGGGGAGGITYPAPLQKWMTANLDFIQTMAATAGASPETSPYWYNVNLVLHQFNGLVQGYNDHCEPSKKLSTFDLYMLNSAGDLETLIEVIDDDEALKKKKKPKTLTQRFKQQALDDNNYLMTDCSALIKVLPDLSDIYVGHTTWRSYMLMNRIYKFYNFELSKYAHAASKAVSFSSSPGFLSSKDDFYIMDSGLVTQETTNSIFNNSVYTGNMSPNSVLTFMRTIVANRMASNGQEWTEIFAYLNSGSYDNQWMIVDYNQFTPGSAIKPNTLWIIEQLPGYTESADVSSILASQTYWASYNIPYFQYIFNISGYPERVAQYGDAQYSYENCARANIFRREQAKIKTFEDMKAMMQYNDWQHDPLSLGTPAYAIASRYDLVAKANPPPFGGVDSKVTSYRRARALEASAISGPTHYDNSQPVFTWNNPLFSKYSHVGQPDTFDFDYVDMQMDQRVVATTKMPPPPMRQ